MRGVGKVKVAPRDAFPPFPSHYMPGRPHLTAMFVQDYHANKPYIMRELRAMLSSHAMAVDHQRKVVKRTLGEGVVGHGGQMFTICGDYGIVLGVYVVPDTDLSWEKQAMSEVVDRHRSVGIHTNILSPVLPNLPYNSFSFTARLGLCFLCLQVSGSSDPHVPLHGLCLLQRKAKFPAH